MINLSIYALLEYTHRTFVAHFRSGLYSSWIHVVIDIQITKYKLQKIASFEIIVMLYGRIVWPWYMSTGMHSIIYFIIFKHQII